MVKMMLNHFILLSTFATRDFTINGYVSVFAPMYNAGNHYNCVALPLHVAGPFWMTCAGLHRMV